VPSVQNDAQLNKLLENSVRQAWGEEALQLIPEPSLGAEDFALYLEHAPGAMFRLGTGFGDRPMNHPLHHPRFEADEAAILTGVVTLSYAAWQYWQNIAI
jgi:metal-dependent amidase/aminoacylase/carboxypeptidase family protein